MATTTERTLRDRCDGIERQIHALGRQAGEWDVSDLPLLAYLEAGISDVRRKVVEGMRETGVTDKQIGEALNITQQAVSKRWPGGGRFVGAAGRYRKPTAEQDEVIRAGRQ